MSIFGEMHSSKVDTNHVINPCKMPMLSWVCNDLHLPALKLVWTWMLMCYFSIYTSHLGAHPVCVTLYQLDFRNGGFTFKQVGLCV